MKFKAEIQVLPHPEIHEPQGHTVARHLDKLNINGVSDLRIGKFMVMQLEADSEVEAHEKVNAACTKLLANPIIESYSFHLSHVEEEGAALSTEEAVDEEIAEPAEALSTEDTAENDSDSAPQSEEE